MRRFSQQILACQRLAKECSRDRNIGCRIERGARLVERAHRNNVWVRRESWSAAGCQLERHTLASTARSIELIDSSLACEWSARRLLEHLLGLVGKPPRQSIRASNHTGPR